MLLLLCTPVNCFLFNTLLQAATYLTVTDEGEQGRGNSGTALAATLHTQVLPHAKLEPWCPETRAGEHCTEPSSHTLKHLPHEPATGSDQPSITSSQERATSSQHSTEGRETANKSYADKT